MAGNIEEQQQYLDDLRKLVSNGAINWEGAEGQRIKDLQQQFGFGSNGFKDRVEAEIAKVATEIEEARVQQQEEEEQAQQEEQVQQPEERQEGVYDATTGTDEAVSEQEARPQATNTSAQIQQEMVLNGAEIKNHADAVKFMRDEANRNYLVNLFEKQVSEKASDIEKLDINSEQFALCMDVLNHPKTYMNKDDNNKQVFDFVDKMCANVAGKILENDEFKNDLLNNTDKKSSIFSTHLKRMAFDVLMNPGKVKNPETVQKLKNYYDENREKLKAANDKFSKEYSKDRADKAQELENEGKKIEARNQDLDTQYKNIIARAKGKIKGKVSRVCSRITTPFVRFSGWMSSKVSNFEKRMDNAKKVVKSLPKRAFVAGVNAASNMLQERQQKKITAQQQVQNQGRTNSGSPA